MRTRLIRWPLAGALAALGLVAGSVVDMTAGALSTTPAAATTAIVPTLVVSNARSLTSYPLSASGNASPSATVSTGSLASVAFDAYGNAWVTAANTVLEYTAAQLVAGGTPTPAVTITSDSSGSLSGPGPLAFDASGDLWVVDGGNTTIVEYTAAQLAAGGALTPAVTIAAEGSGASASLDNPQGIAFDAAGDLWVANSSTPDLVEFLPSELNRSGTSSPVPAVVITSPPTSGIPSLDGAAGLAFDAAGNLWVAAADGGSNTDGAVVEYSPSELTATGHPVPVALISSVSGSLYFPNQIAFDAAGNLWVVNLEGGGASHLGSVVEYAPSQLVTGSPAPVDMIAGPGTNLNGAFGLAIEESPTVISLSATTGPSAGGTALTISGTGFTRLSTVDFGTEPATLVSYVTPYELRAVSPAGTGTLGVSVTSFAGSSPLSAASQFVYAAPPPTTTAPPATTTTTAPPPTTTTTTTVPTTTTTLPPRPLLRFSGHVARVVGAVAEILLSCTASSCRGTLRLTTRVRIRVRLRHAKRFVFRDRTLVLATSHYVLRAGEHSAVRVLLDRAARVALARSRNHRVTVEVIVTLVGGRRIVERVTLFAAPHHVRHRAKHPAKHRPKHLSNKG